MNSKLIRILYFSNLIWYILTAGLFLTIYLGLFAEFFLGILQIVSSILLLFIWKHLSDKIKRKLFIYWILTTIYFLAWLIDWSFLDGDLVFIVGLCLIPMGIGAFFLSIVYQIKNSISTLKPAKA